MSRAGIVAALAAEARALCAALPPSGSLTTLDDGTLLAVSGVGYPAADRAARALLEAGAGGLISFGLAGGLDPALRAGTLVLPDEVCSTERPNVPVDAAWRRRLITALPAGQPFVGGKLWTSLTPILDTGAKRRLFAASSAPVVDMEAMAVASAASAAATPFLAVKVIVDTALDTLPRAVMAIDPAGRVRAARVVVTLLRHPGEIITLIRLAGRYLAAQRMLRGIAAIEALRQPTVEINTR